MNAPTEQELIGFVLHEARLIDQHRFEEWLELFADDGEEPKLSVSIGIASYPADAETIGPLLYAADASLYLIKNQKREACG